MLEAWPGFGLSALRHFRFRLPFNLMCQQFFTRWKVSRFSSLFALRFLFAFHFSPAVGLSCINNSFVNQLIKQSIRTNASSKCSAPQFAAEAVPPLAKLCHKFSVCSPSLSEPNDHSPFTTHSLAHLFMHSFTHSFIHSLIHLFIHLSVNLVCASPPWH